MLKFNVDYGYVDEGRINACYRNMDKADYFDVTPRIFPANKDAVIRISSKDKHMKLSGTYLVMVVPQYEFEFVPFKVSKNDIISVEAVNGDLTFSYYFKEEQMYRLIIGEETEQGLGVLLRTELYALASDYYELKTFIGDFHSHTICSDGFESPEMVVDSAVKLGLDFLAVTDHNSYRGSVLASEYATIENKPITIINGEEYSSSFTNMHIISLGAKQPLEASEYCFHMPEECTGKSTVTYTKELCRKIHDNGGISVMCHPLWKPFRTDGVRMDVPMSLVKELMQNNVFDAIEVVGGSPIEDNMTSQMQYTWAVSFGATADRVAYLGSTDSHCYSTDPICGKHITLVLAKTNSQADIIEAVRERRTVAMQILDDSNVLCYGTPRNCMFASFYYKNYMKL